MYRSLRKHHNYSSNGHLDRGRNKSRFNKLDANLFVKNSITADKYQVYSSSTEFSAYNIAAILKQNIINHGYDKPTEIQEKAIPDLLSGRDIIGIAHTGTGKTAAFLITLINKCYFDKHQRVLIVVPTRELASQINDEFEIFAHQMNITSSLLIGGENINRQVSKLRQGPQFVIGTPGRIIDLIKQRKLNLQFFNNVVLDEVDRMVDIGFIKDIKYILSILPVNRQSLFFSATVDSKTAEIIKTFVKNPVTVSVRQSVPAINIKQDIIKLSNNSSKVDVLHDLLIRPGFEKIIIFGRTKWSMEKLTRVLVERGFKAVAIHGNKSQNQRQNAIRKFKTNQAQILIATDIASRGLDIDDVTHVINYDPPNTYDDYIHRIGRTGRAGKAGVALTFVEN